MPLVNLAEFGLLNKTCLVDALKEIYKKLLIDDYLISNLITSIITSLGIAMTNDLEKSIVIHSCQVSELDQLDEKDIREISNEIVHNWEQMIKEDKELLEIKIDMANTGYKIDNNNQVGI